MPQPPIENRRIYEHAGKYWMSLTLEELFAYAVEAPEMIYMIEGEPCTEIIVHRKMKES